MLKLFANRWLIRVFGLGAIAVVVLVAGPPFAFGNVRPLASLTARLILIALIAAA